MANTFGILTALVLAFSAFVAFKNKEEFDLQKDITETEQANFDTNTNTYNGLLVDIEEREEDIKEANESRDEVKAELAEQTTKNEELEKTIASKEQELARLTDQVADAEDKLKELGPIAELAPKIERLNGEIADLEDEVAILKASIDRLKGEKSRTAEAESAAKTKLRNINSGRSLASMKTRIEQIDRRLGFVTLADGIKSGVVGGSKVAVMRGGEKIGELSVTAVSANAATADILHSTIKEDTDVAVGDTVVPLEGGEPEAGE